MKLTEHKIKWVNQIRRLKMKNKYYGSVDWRGKRYQLTQQAYASNYGTDGGIRYHAVATDDDGGSYRVAWETTPEYDEACAQYARREHLTMERASRQLTQAEAEDLKQLEEKNLDWIENEENACDWDHPVSVME